MQSTHTWLRTLYGRGFKFPNTYVVFDLETTGNNLKSDLILQLGYLVVVDGVPREKAVAHLLDWTANEKVDQNYLRQRIVDTGEHMRRRGSDYNFTYEALSDGVDPISVLRGCLDESKKWQTSGLPVVVHNGYQFDLRMLEIHFGYFLDDPFKFDDNLVIDTGLVEKAIQAQPKKLLMPKSGNALKDFYDQTAATFLKAPWSLTRHCVPKYRLDTKYDIDVRNAHTADFDCTLTHLLYQEYRKLALEKQ